MRSCRPLPGVKRSSGLGLRARRECQAAWAGPGAFPGGIFPVASTAMIGQVYVDD